MNLLSPRRIVHVQLSQRLQPLRAGDAGRGMYAVFWLDDLPLGHEYFDAAELPIPPRDLAAVAADCVAAAVTSHLFASWQHPLAPTDGSSSAGRRDPHSELLATLRPFAEASRRKARTLKTVGLPVSVVVTTREHPEGLARCLRSVQQLATRPHEVLIVDLTTDGRHARAVADSFGYALHRPAREANPGAAPGGWVPPATGDVVAFTDDRSAVHPAWLEAIEAAFHDRNVAVVSGLVLPAALDTEAQVAFERLLGGAHLGFEPRTYDHASLRSRGGPCLPRLGSSANLAVRAASLAEMAVDWGVTAGRTLEGVARWELWPRLLADGRTGRYEPGAVVFRDHPREPDEIEKEAFRWPCDLAAATRSFDHGLQAGIGTALPTGRHLLITAARDIALGSRLQRRVFGAGVAGYLSALGARLYGTAISPRRSVRPADSLPRRARNTARKSSVSTTM